MDSQTTPLLWDLDKCQNFLWRSLKLNTIVVCTEDESLFIPDMKRYSA